MDNLTWVIIADSSKARVFAAYKAKLLNSSPDVHDLIPVSEHHHHNSRKKDSQLTTDKLGDFGKGTFVEATDPKQHEAELFSHQLAQILLKGHNQHRYRDIILVAPPTFMGLLNKNLTHEIDKLVSLRIEKDYTQAPSKELVTHIVEWL